MEEWITYNPDFASKLTRGKYSRWAERLDLETLESLLCAVATFSRDYCAMRTPEGFPAVSFHKHAMNEFRMIGALEAFRMIYSTGKPPPEWSVDRKPREHCGPHQEYSPTVRAFSRRFRERLSSNDCTAWAEKLDERTFATLLWEVGEYGIRVNDSKGPDGGPYPPPTFESTSEDTKPMRSALRLIAMIHAGGKYDLDEAARILSEDQF